MNIMFKAIVGLIQYFGRQITYRGRLEDKIDKVLTRQNDVERRLLRLEIISAMERKDKTTVHSLYDIYRKEYDGNSYMTEMYEDFCKSFNKRKRK